MQIIQEKAEQLREEMGLDDEEGEADWVNEDAKTEDEIFENAVSQVRRQNYQSSDDLEDIVTEVAEEYGIKHRAGDLYQEVA